MAKVKQTLTAPSAGAQLIDQIMTWILGFVSMPREYAIVAALYAVHTYVYRRYDSVAYLSLTSAEPQAGKTTMLRTICALADNGQYSADPTKATLFAMIDDAYDRKRNITIGWDECEKAARESDERREIINSGYTSDGKVLRVNRAWQPGSDLPRHIEQRTFCPKILSGIGSLAHTIRDRSIVLLMRHGKAGKRADISMIKREANAFHNDIVATVNTLFPPNGSPLTMAECEWLESREYELWGPLFTTARYLQLSAAQMTLLRSACDLLIEMKHSDQARRYTLARKAEDKTLTANGLEPLGRVALRDLVSVFGKDSKLWTVTIVDRMNALPQWREYRGKGLNDQYLSDLIGTFGIKPKQVKVKGKNRRGYLLADVRKAVEKAQA